VADKVVKATIVAPRGAAWLTAFTSTLAARFGLRVRAHTLLPRVKSRAAEGKGWARGLAMAPMQCEGGRTGPSVNPHCGVNNNAARAHP